MLVPFDPYRIPTFVPVFEEVFESEFVFESELLRVLDKEMSVEVLKFSRFALELRTIIVKKNIHDYFSYQLSTHTFSHVNNTRRHFDLLSDC